MKTISFQLENTVLELRGRGVSIARKKRPKLSSSQPNEIRGATKVNQSLQESADMAETVVL